MLPDSPPSNQESEVLRPESWGSASVVRKRASFLLEYAIALTVLSVGLLGFLVTLKANASTNMTMEDLERARVTLQAVYETLRGAQFDQVVSTFDGQVLPSSAFASGQTTITCYVDETTLPAAFGPVLDLDGDGLMTTVDVSANYLLLPVQLTLSYQSHEGLTVIHDLYLVLGP